jgi:hypothetical protein
MISDECIGKNVEGRSYGISTLAWGDLGKLRKPLRIVSVPAEIRTEYLSNASL